MSKPQTVRAQQASVSDGAWRALGHGVDGFERDAVVLLTGNDLGALAAIALGVAHSAGAQRRVAIFDLAGAFGREDDDGLTLAFRDGRSLNALARPIEATSLEHFLVPRGPGEVDATFARHERWPRLIEGFRATGSLLVILATDRHGPASTTRPVRAHGGLTDEFAAIADRALVARVRHGLPTLEPFAPRRTDDVDGETGNASPIAALPSVETERVLPRTTPTIPGRLQVDPYSQPAPPPRKWERRIVIVVLVGAALAGEWIWSNGRPAEDDSALSLPATLAAREPAPTPEAVDVPGVVNPEDAGRAAMWGVELRVTNDRAVAYYILDQHASVPAATISPLWVSGDPVAWHSIIAGATRTREEAVNFRTSLRRTGVIDQEEGVIAEVPFALRIASGLKPSEALDRVDALAADSVPAYALRDDDGTAAIYAGAFTRPEQSVHLLVQLRRMNLDPVFAYRVGRTY